AAHAVHRSQGRREAHHRTVNPEPRTPEPSNPRTREPANPRTRLRVTVLGSGTSHGVPAIGCDCVVCRSSDPKDRRTRPSILIEIDGDRDADPPFARAVRSILVDTSTDLRMQALANDVRRVDAILFTHSHADHVFGLDDVRRYNQMQHAALPCYADARTLADLRHMFSYIFEPPRQKGGGLPQLTLFEIAGRFPLGGAAALSWLMMAWCWTPTEQPRGGRDPFSGRPAPRALVGAGARARQLRRAAPRTPQDSRSDVPGRDRARRHRRRHDLRSASAA